MGEGDKYRWVAAVSCDNCSDFYKDIPIKSEEQTNRFTILMKEKKRISRHKDYEPDSKCDGNIHVRKITDTQKEKKKEKKEPTDDTLGIDDDDVETFENVIMTKGMVYAKKLADIWFYKNFERKIIHDKRLIRLFGPYGYGKSTFLRCLRREQTYKKHCIFVPLKIIDLMTGKIADVESNIDKLFDTAIELYREKGITTVFTLDEKELLLNSRDDKSSKELSLATGILLEKLGIPWNEAPGYLLIMATNREFDMDGAADSRSEDAYFAVFDDKERAQMLKRSLGRAKIDKKSVPTDKNIDCDKMTIYVKQYDGRNFASISNKYANWYMDNIEKRIFEEGHVVTEKQCADFLDKYRLELEQQLEIRQSRIPKRNKPYFRGRIDDDDPNKPILVIKSKHGNESTVKEMAISVMKWTGDTIENIYKKYNIKFDDRERPSADPELTKDYNNFKKINDMKKEFDRMNKEE